MTEVPVKHWWQSVCTLFGIWEIYAVKMIHSKYVIEMCHKSSFHAIYSRHKVTPTLTNLILILIFNNIFRHVTDFSEQSQTLDTYRFVHFNHVSGLTQWLAMISPQ